MGTGHRAVECWTCQKHFPDKEKLLKHKDRHHSDCWECGKHFTSKESLGKHREATGHNSMVECWKCRKQFKSRDALNQHRQDVHSSTTSRPSYFRISGQVSTSRRSSNKSKRSTRSRGRASEPDDEVCRKCDKHFKTMNSLKRHLQASHNITLKSEPNDEASEPDDEVCRKCDKHFKTMNSLKQHLQSSHNITLKSY